MLDSWLWMWGYLRLQVRGCTVAVQSTVEEGESWQQVPWLREMYFWVKVKLCGLGREGRAGAGVTQGHTTFILYRHSGPGETKL